MTRIPRANYDMRWAASDISLAQSDMYIGEEDHMLWEGMHYPLFRVKSFGRFVLEKLINESSEQPPRYEAIPEEVWRSRFAACDLFKILSEPHSFCVLLTPLVPIS